MMPDFIIKEELMLKLKITVTLFTPTITTHTSVILLLVSTHLPMKHIPAVIWQVTVLPFASFLVCDTYICTSA